MSPRFRTYLLALCASVLCALAILVAFKEPLAVGQVNVLQRWNPRRVPVGTEYIGDQACAECHKRASASFAKTGMALGMEQIGSSKVLTENPNLTLQLGPYKYEVKRDGKQSTYSVTDGKDTISVPIQYALGQGRMGQTYVLEHEGKFYESRMSFYNETKALDFTVGSPRGVPATLTEAFGRELQQTELVSCFGCHSSYATTGQKLWQTDMGDRVVTPISYMLDGKQYVSVVARPGPAARVFTFVLDGTAPMPPPSLPGAVKGKGK